MYILIPIPAATAIHMCTSVLSKSINFVTGCIIAYCNKAMFYAEKTTSKNGLILNKEVGYRVNSGNTICRC